MSDYERFFRDVDIITTEPRYEKGPSYLAVEDLYQAFKERMIDEFNQSFKELNLQKEETSVKQVGLIGVSARNKTVKRVF